MRMFLMATAAVCLTAGAALAQTSAASPAPTGAPNAAMTAPGNASPGNMAPNDGDSSTTTKPVYSGQNSIAKVPANSVPNANPGEAANAPGTMMPAQNVASNATPMHRAMTYHHAMSLPENADARTYLKIAADAIRQHQKAMADDALSHAETRLLTRAVPASAGAEPDQSPAIDAIEHARSALASGDYRLAAADTKMAMHAHHGMMNGSMGGAGDMSGPAE
jgi:hypothetical protein